jgi:GGDEF domain-containing protein
MLQTLLVVLAAAGGASPIPAAAAPPWRQQDVVGQFWIDASGQAPLQAAQAAFQRGEGQPADPRRIMPLGSGPAVWYRLQMPVVQQPARAVFSVTFPGMDLVELHQADGAGGWQAQASGDALAVNNWPVRYLTPAFALTLQPGDTEPRYLRVRHSQSLRVMWLLQDERSFIEQVELWHLGLGAYAGFIVMVVLLSIGNTLSWRDPIHLYYAVHVVLVGLSIMSLTGLGGEYLWPSFPWWNNQAPFLLPAASLTWAGLFARELVAERGAKLVSWLLLGHVAVSLLLMVAFLVLGRERLYRAPTVYYLPGLMLLLGVLAWYSVRRPKVGLWVLGGIVILVLGSLFPLMHNLGWVGTSVLTLHGTQMGAAMEIPLVLVGLYFRSRERKHNLARMEALEHTDPLTGLGNHRVLVERLEELLKRSRRDPTRGAVLRVHVANLSDILAEHGREAAEAALVRAAECVAKEASEDDLVAREQGSDLVLVMEGRVGRLHTADAGRNIIARGLKFSRRLPPGVTLNLQVAGVCAPLRADDALGLLAMLGRMILNIGAEHHGKPMRVVETSDSSTPHRSSPGSQPVVEVS